MGFFRFLGQNYPLYRILNLLGISLLIFEHLLLKEIKIDVLHVLTCTVTYNTRDIFL